LIKAEGEPLILPVPQPGLEVGPAGSPRVNGAGQLGTTLLVDGLTPAYVVRAGQFLSVIVDGRRFVYVATEDVVADGSGAAALKVGPMIRRSPADNAVVEIAQPMIEGFVQGPAS